MLLYGILAFSFLIGIYFLSRGNASPYKFTKPELFSPLTHLEIKQRKPFIWKLSNNEKIKWVYECNLLKTSNLSILWQNKDQILSGVENTKLEFSLEYVIIYLTKLLYQIGEKPKGILKRNQFKRYFFNYCFDNIEATVKVFNDMLSYQTQLFFFMKVVREKLITQQEEFFKTNGDLCWPEVKRGPKYISNIFLKLNSEKSKTDTKKKINRKIPPSK